VIFNFLRVAFFGLAVVLVSSCVTAPLSSPASDLGQGGSGAGIEKLVMSRAQQRWDALMAGELNQAYAFISPSGRAKLQAQDYRARVNTAHFRKAVVQEATCQQDSCEVKVSLDYVVGNLPLNQILSEIWILDEGKWWFVYRG
jgi:hypothetical protein